MCKNDHLFGGLTANWAKRLEAAPLGMGQEWKIDSKFCSRSKSLSSMSRGPWNFPSEPSFSFSARIALSTLHELPSDIYIYMDRYLRNIRTQLEVEMDTVVGTCRKLRGLCKCGCGCGYCRRRVLLHSGILFCFQRLCLLRPSTVSLENLIQRWWKSKDHPK